MMMIHTVEELSAFSSSVFHSVLNGVVNAVEKTKTEEELRVGQGFTKEVTFNVFYIHGPTVHWGPAS